MHYMYITVLFVSSSPDLNLILAEPNIDILHRDITGGVEAQLVLENGSAPNTLMCYIHIVIPQSLSWWLHQDTTVPFMLAIS